MIDNLLGGDDDETTADESDEEMGGLFDDPGDAAGGGGDDMMGGDDDLMSGDDDLMGGDDGMAFDDGDDGGTSNSEMNNRMEELENEVASLSSSVNTVKSENEQISESLDDVEENIRKLLEVYEMVTRGVNPFVNENELGDAFGGGGGGGGGGSMGLFGDDEPQEESSDIDDSVANADADDFFDDDLDGDFDEGDDFEDDLDGVDDEFDEDLEGGDEFEDDDLEDDGGDGGDSGGGKSFEELKSEYESGDADWEAGETGGEEADGAASTVDDESETGAVDDLEIGDSVDEDLDEDPGTDDASPIAGADANGTGDPTATADDDADTGTGATVEGGKPYLQELPAGYAADVVVMDWLEFLVDEGGVDGAARTIAYYEAIDWVSETAAESLHTYLQGFGDGVEADPEPRSWLTVSHHNTSLRFISRIDNPSMEMVAFDERSVRPWREDTTDGTPAGGAAAGNGHGPEREFVAEPAGEPELESDGGRRTHDEGDGSSYDPAASRRGREAYSDENDSGCPTGEVGYGGFCWNHDGN